MSVLLTDFLTFNGQTQTEEIEGIPTIMFSIGPVHIHETDGHAFFASPAFKLVHTETSTANGETVTLTPVCVSWGNVPTSMGDLMATSARPSSGLLKIRQHLMSPELRQIQQDAQHMTAESDVHPLLHGLLRSAGEWTTVQSLEIKDTARRHGFPYLGFSRGSDGDGPLVFATTGKVIYLQSRAHGVRSAEIHMFILPGMACRTESTGSVGKSPVWGIGSVVTLSIPADRQR